MAGVHLSEKVVPAAPGPSQGAVSGCSCAQHCFPSPRTASLVWWSATCAAAAQRGCGKPACN